MRLRTLIRPLLGLPFAVLGADALREPGAKAAKAATIGPAIARPLHLPEDPETLVRINGGVMVAAGSLLAIGRLPRLSALALAGVLVPTTLAGHAFWEETDKQARTQQRIQFLKNVGLFGGLLLAAFDRGGSSSRRHRPAPPRHHDA